MQERSVASLDAQLQRQVEGARTAFERGHYELALEYSRAVLRAEPGCLPVRKLHRAAAQRRSAAGASLLARAMGSVSSAPFLLTGNMKLVREPLKAVESAERMIEADPRSAAACKLLGQAAASLGWKETAVYAYETACECAPRDAECAVALGEALLAAGRAAEAIRAAEQALTLSPINARAQSLVKNASVASSLEQGRWDAGGNYREKLKDEQRAITLEQATKSSVAAAAAAPARPQSRPELEAFVEKYPGDAPARVELGRLLQQAGDCDGAIRHFQQVVGNPRTRHAALLGLGRCFRRKGIADLALLQLETAKSELTEMSDLKKDVLYELGLSHESAGAVERAMAEFKLIYAVDIGYRDIADKINHFYARH